MKIVALVRSLNEERFIGRCLNNHKWCDKVLVADGGSDDSTKNIATTFDNVLLRQFIDRIELSDGSFMNPEPGHINFLLDWADDEDADWVLLADCDTWPNIALQYNARHFMVKANLSGLEGIFATQLYMWGENEYFPKINEPGPNQWAWRADLGLRWPDGNNNFEVVAPGPNKDNSIVLKKPYVVLHYVSDQIREEEKIKRYKSWGHPKTHLLESIYAPPEPLPDWAKEYQV